MEINYLYILLIISLIVGTFLLYKIEGKIQLNQINIFNWTYFVEFIVMGAISPFIIYRYKYENWVLKHIPDADFPFKEVVYTLIWSAITIPIGIYLANLVLNKLNYKTSYSNFLKEPILDFGSKFFFPIWVFILFTYMGFIINQIGFVPQIKIFSLNTFEIAKLRGDISHNLPANIIIFRLFGLTIPPILCFASLVKLIKHRNLKNVCYFFLLTCCAIFFNTINLNKSGLVLFLIGIIATFGVANVNFGLKKLAGCAIVAYLILIVTFQAVIPNQKQDYETTVKNVFGRIALAQTYGNYVSYYIFPRYEEHIGFRSISKQLKILGIQPKERASRLMMRHMAPKKVEDGRAGHMVSTFFAEAWANWGLPGVIFSPIIVGFILKITIAFLINLPKSELSLAFIAYLTYTFGLSKSFSKILFPRYLIASFIILFGMVLIEKGFMRLKLRK